MALSSGDDVLIERSKAYSLHDDSVAWDGPRRCAPWLSYSMQKWSSMYNDDFAFFSRDFAKGVVVFVTTSMSYLTKCAGFLAAHMNKPS